MFYLVDAFMILQPGKVHLFDVAGVTGRWWARRHGPGGAAPASAQPPTPPDTPTPQDPREHPKPTHGYGDNKSGWLGGGVLQRQTRQSLRKWHALVQLGK